MTETDRPRLRPSWPALRELLTEARQDWDASTPDLDPVAAVLAAENAGVPFETALWEALRILLDPKGKPEQLRTLAAEHARSQGYAGRGLTREERDELRANAIGRCEAATERFASQRRTGPQPALREPGRDP